MLKSCYNEIVGIFYGGIMDGRNEQKTFHQIMLMCWGFFGIQFGWALQMGNMSAIYSRLGASESQIPMLWLAAPVTGL